MNNYGYIENPMVLPMYQSDYDEDEEKGKQAYLEDVAWNDFKDKSLNL